MILIKLLRMAALDNIMVKNGRKKMKKRILLLLLGLMLLVACAGSESMVSPLSFTAWQLIEMDGDIPLPDTSFTIEFSEVEVSGKAGCNIFSGSYSANEDSITLSDLYSTEMACMEPEGVMEQEQIFLGILRDASTLQMDSEQLTLMDGERRTLVFIKAGEVIPGELAAENPDDAVSATRVPEGQLSSTIERPSGHILFTDGITGISIFYPESWVVSEDIPGEYAILQSYPLEKYVGGEMLEAGDTKCDLYIQSENTKAEDLIAQWESDPMVEFNSMEAIELPNGVLTHRIVIESMGTTLVYVVELEPYVVTLTCFGEFEPVDEFAETLHVRDK